MPKTFKSSYPPQKKSLKNSNFNLLPNFYKKKPPDKWGFFFKTQGLSYNLIERVLDYAFCAVFLENRDEFANDAFVHYSLHGHPRLVG